jgi:hypothetical protein
MRAAFVRGERGVKAAPCQMLASRRLAPMKEPRDAAKRIDARWNDGPELATVSGSEEVGCEFRL